MSFWSVLRISSSGLRAQRLRLDLIANNVANVETTRSDDGGPFQRSDVIFREEGGPFASVLMPSRSGDPRRVTGPVGGVRVEKIVRDSEPGPRIYDPSHPDADEEGYVTYPNVNIVVEMTNMISATRSYEANLSVIEAAKRLALKALEIGR